MGLIVQLKDVLFIASENSNTMSALRATPVSASAGTVESTSGAVQSMVNAALVADATCSPSETSTTTLTSLASMQATVHVYANGEVRPVNGTAVSSRFRL